MSDPVKAIPEGMHSVTPHLICAGAADAIAFYVQAFGAKEMTRMPGPDGALMHAMIRIGDASIMLMDENVERKSLGPNALGGTPVTIHLYVEDADAVFAQAVAAGASARMPPADMFWGDRYGVVVDPFGHHWAIATHRRDVTPEQMVEEMKTMFSK